MNAKPGGTGKTRAVALLAAVVEHAVFVGSASTPRAGAFVDFLAVRLR